MIEKKIKAIVWTLGVFWLFFLLLLLLYFNFSHIKVWFLDGLKISIEVLLSLVKIFVFIMFLYNAYTFISKKDKKGDNYTWKLEILNMFWYFLMFLIL